MVTGVIVRGMNNRVILYLFVLIFFQFTLLYGSNIRNNGLLIKNSWNFYRDEAVLKRKVVETQIYNPKLNLYEEFDLTVSYDSKVVNDRFPVTWNYKGENLLRRAEILFFGSLTIITFMGWLTFSAFNSLMYQDTFGTLDRYQVMSLYLGSSVISLAVSLSDLFIRLQPYFKNLKFYD